MVEAKRSHGTTKISIRHRNASCKAEEAKNSGTAVGTVVHSRQDCDAGQQGRVLVSPSVTQSKN